MACGNVLCAQNFKCMNPNSCHNTLYGPQVNPTPSGIPIIPTNMSIPQNKDRGWVCPKCDSVWAPFVPCCFTCNKKAPSDIKSTVT